MAHWIRLDTKKLIKIEKTYKNKRGAKKRYVYIAINLGDEVKKQGWQPDDKVTIYLLAEDPSQVLLVNESLKYRRRLKEMEEGKEEV